MNDSTKTVIKPAAALILITPVLTELLSGNTPAGVFFQPQVLVFLWIAYGLAALLIREMGVASGMGVAGFLIAGIAYGFYNEGVCAKTLLMSATVPLSDSFGAYRYQLWFGMNVAWASLILFWHALHSVLYPILIVHFLYPQARTRPWLKAWGRWAAFAAVAGLGVLSSFGPARFKAPGIYFFVFWAAIAVLLFVARKCARFLPLKEPAGKARLAPAALGFAFALAYTLGLLICGRHSVPVPFLWGYAALVVVSFGWFLRRNRWFSVRDLVLFGLGHYTADATLLLMRGIQIGSAEFTATALILACAFVAGIFQIVHRGRGELLVK